MLVNDELYPLLLPGLRGPPVAPSPTLTIYDPDGNMCFAINITPPPPPPAPLY